MAASLELAISAIRSGRKEEGRQLLNLLIQQNPNDDKAWLWMSSVVNTDEQRARCLYHVLAINPNSELARKGLQVLGIVVSDSRPVKVPRDSRPIKIPRPTPASAVPEERRPFLIDPQAITDELPFTPLNAPFAEDVQASPSILAIDVDEEVADIPTLETTAAEQSEQTQNPSKPIPVTDSAETEEDTAQLPAKPGLLARLQKPSPAPSSADTQDMSSPSAAQTESPQTPPKPELVVTAEETKQLAPQSLPGQTQTLPSPSEPVPVVGSGETQTPAAPLPVQTPQLQNPSEPVPVVQADVSQAAVAPMVVQAVQSQNPSEPVPVVTPNQPMSGGGQPGVQPAPLQNPSEPVPVVQSNVNPGMTPQPQIQPGTGPLQAAMPLPGQLPAPGSGPLPPDTQTYHQSPQPSPSGQLPYDTRPSQPVPVVYPDANMGVAQNNPTPQYPASSPQAPVNQAGATVGMSPHQAMQPQNLVQQPMPSVHSNTTMGMPLPAHNSQLQHPSEPVPVIHPNNAPGMNPYEQAQMPQGMAIHSSSTTMMPAMSEAEARARLAAGQAIPTANAAAMALQSPPGQFGMFANPMGNVNYGSQMGGYSVEDEEDETEEVNILAVIIFRTLSVTALGGLGMLILLVFTSPAG